MQGCFVESLFVRKERIMKKTMILIFILLFATSIFLVGCGRDDEIDNSQEPSVNGQENDGEIGNDDSNDEESDQNDTKNDNDEEAVLKSHDFYPFLENTRLHYDGEGSEFASERVHFDYMTDSRAQIRRETAGTTILEVIEYREGKVYSLLQYEAANRKESFYDHNVTIEDSEGAEVLIMEPIESGTQWTVREGVIRQITGVNLSLDTPAGTFNGIEVTTFEDGSEFIVYYAKGYGKIKTRFEAGDTVICSELVEVEEDYQTTENHKFFYPDFNQNQLVFLDEEITLGTNDSIEGMFEEYFQKAPKDSQEYTQLMSENTRINYIRLNRENFVAHIDFSEEFLTEMNAGSSLENMILTSVVRTIGEYFLAEEVLITIEEEPYQSGHFEFGEGETLENVPVDNEVEIQR